MNTIRIAPVKPVTPINPNHAQRVRVLYGKQTVVGTNGYTGSWAYVADPKRVYA